MKNRLLFFISILTIILLASCSKDKGGEQNSDTFDVSKITLPSTMEALAGGTVSIKAPKGTVELTDIVTFYAVSSQAQYVCKIASIGETAFDVTLHKDLVNGRYTVHIKRGEQDRTLGVTTLRIKADDSLDPQDATVYGKVLCEGKGVANVSVSDGYELVRTDKDGVYRIKSKKTRGVVFMSIPSGYEPLQDGFLPRFHAVLTEEENVPERADFQLVKTENPNYTLIVMGDMHLAARNNDRAEFKKFTSDVRDYLAAHPQDKVYGLTLGDMTWDQYWYDNSYYFPQYLDDMNSKANGVDGLMTFHTIGNHDHDMKAAGDLLTQVKYVKDIAPTYYSFDLGSIHYVVLDNIHCTNSGAGTAASRDYNVLVDEDEYTWLAKDLSYVDNSTPVVVAMHAPIYYDNSSSSSLEPYVGYAAMKKVITAFSGYSVHFLTGHTHRVLNTEKSGHYDHNAGAICASWWWSQKLSNINLCTDGAPGGYALWDVTGSDFKWQYVGTGKAPDDQFRSYDLNNVAFDTSTIDTYVPKGSAWARDRFLEYFAASYPKRSDNLVLLNVWNYGPGWTVSVTENGVPVEAKQVKRMDPLHILALSAPRFNAITNESTKDDPSFLTNWSSHLFEVQASSANSTLEITVTDPFGNVSRETMTRPKAFTLANYR